MNGDLRRLQPQEASAPGNDGEAVCIACTLPMKLGDRFYPDAGGGVVHAACLGPERESYTLNGEPLGPNDPIPAPSIWLWQ